MIGLVVKISGIYNCPSWVTKNAFETTISKIETDSNGGLDHGKWWSPGWVNKLTVHFSIWIRLVFGILLGEVIQPGGVLIHESEFKLAFLWGFERDHYSAAKLIGTRPIRKVTIFLNNIFKNGCSDFVPCLRINASRLAFDKWKNLSINLGKKAENPHHSERVVVSSQSQFIVETNIEIIPFLQSCSVNAIP